MKAWNDHPQPIGGLSYVAQVSSDKIGYLASLLEAYDGLAVLRTKDPALGIVEFWISPLMKEDFESFLATMGKELGLKANAPTPIEADKLQIPKPKHK